LILSIDTSHGTSAAVFSSECLSFVSFDDPYGHAETIGLAIEKALTEARVTVEQLTSVAVGRGPAPYTGLRVGMAAATALSKARSLPLLGVITLDAIAHAMDERDLLVVTDAKRKELFAATYQAGKRVQGPMLLTANDLGNYPGFQLVEQHCDAKLIGSYAQMALKQGIDLSELSALYLRSPDVTPSAGKKVSG
jgi:tRNA threonylcarbamoyladenosine biosynthesis protein TsaB